MVSLKQIDKVLKKNLSEHRYKHTLAVTKAAQSLAIRYGADIDKCKIAAMLHDITKEEDLHKQLQKIKKADIMIDNVVLKSPQLYHSITASIYAKEQFLIEDEDIINAIRYHTTARAGMSDIEKIVYVADGISDDRSYSGVNRFRKLAFVDLDECMLGMISHSLKNLVKNNYLIPIDTIEAYNLLCINLEGFRCRKKKLKKPSQKQQKVKK